MVETQLSRLSRMGLRRKSPYIAQDSGCRVLIMSVSAGAGHVRTAAALEKTFAADARISQVINKDALVYTNKLLATIARSSMRRWLLPRPTFSAGGTRPAMSLGAQMCCGT
jgi:hypothetical protein